MSADVSLVPLADPRGDLLPLRDAVIAALTKVVDSGSYILGPEVSSFEAEMTSRLKVADAVGVGTGTDALVLGLLSVGVQPGDEVITVSHTAGATVAAIKMIGAVPVLIDIEDDNYNLDPSMLTHAAGPRTRAVLPVHLYGHPAAMDSILAFARGRRLHVVEDCAQAQEALFGGRSVGSIGDVGCFSFYPTKNLGALGDGGMISASTSMLGERARLLRTYGWTRAQFSEVAEGRCSRLDEMQAAILNLKTLHIENDVARRRAIAERYRGAFFDLPLTLPSEKPGCRHVFHLYVVRSDRRDQLAAHLRNNGVLTGIHYPTPVHRQPGLAEGCRIPAPLTRTEKVQQEILSLPVFPSLDVTRQERVISAVRSFFGK